MAANYLKRYVCRYCKAEAWSKRLKRQCPKCKANNAMQIDKSTLVPHETKESEVKSSMLILPIKRQWFDMILSGVKTEEYRDITPYYKSRLEHLFKANQFNQIKIRNGYSSDDPSLVAKCSMRIGQGRPEWGAEPGREYYILTIHEVIG